MYVISHRNHNHLLYITQELIMKATHGKTMCGDLQLYRKHAEVKVEFSTYLSGKYKTSSDLGYFSIL